MDEWLKKTRLSSLTPNPTWSRQFTLLWQGYATRSLEKTDYPPQLSSARFTVGGASQQGDSGGGEDRRQGDKEMGRWADGVPTATNPLASARAFKVAWDL